MSSSDIFWKKLSQNIRDILMRNIFHVFRMEMHSQAEISAIYRSCERRRNAQRCKWWRSCRL